MKQLVLPIIALIMIVGSACAPAKSTQANAAIRNAPVATSSNTPMYTAEQVEWIARSFSPDCRVRKPFTGKSG